MGLLAAVVLAPSPASGQAQDTLHLSLADVLARVRAEHPAVRAGAATVQAAEALAAQLRRYANPVLEIERLTSSELEDIRLAQPIRWPWEARALAGIGRANVAAARADSAETLRAAAVDAAERFADGLRDGLALALASQAESLAARGVERAVAARQLGQAGDLTVLQAQVSLDAARRARLAAASALRAAAAGIAIALGEDTAAPIAFQGDLSTLAPIARLDSISTWASGADPRSARLESEAEGAGAEASVARARRWPQLELGPAGRVGKGAAPTLGLGIGLGLPLWNRQGAAIRAATADREAALARLDARRRELAALVLEGTSTLDRADRELGLLRGGELARAQQAESLAARGLSQGGPYLAAWLAARQAYLDAQRAELDLQWQAARARILLRHLSGTLLEETGDGGKGKGR